MKIRRLCAICRKEFIHIIRDPRSLGMAIAMPMLMLILFGYALTLDIDNVPMVIWDQSESNVSREFISQFKGSRYFSIREFIHNYREMEEFIDSGKALMALIIPTDFAKRINSNRSTSVQLIVDGSDSNTATIAMSYVNFVTQNYSQNIATRNMQRISGQTLQIPLAIEPRVWYNNEIESKNYIIPGLIAVIMMVIAALLTSLTVSREWERGTMEQLISTPIKTPELVLGKLFPYFIIGMFDVMLAVLMGQFLFKVPLRGNIFLLFIMTAIFLMGTLSLGMFISITAKTQLLASQMAMVLTFLPSFLLSGFMFSISNMPKAIQVITYLVPARYFIVLLKGIYLKGVGIKVLWIDIGLLIIFSVVILILANKKFKKKLT